MTPGYLDWHCLRGALTMFAGAAVFSAALLLGGAHFERRMEQEYRRHNDQLTALRRRYAAVGEEEEVIRDFLPRFRELYQTGLLGKEHRLNWIEVLQVAGDRLQLPYLGYEIKAQRAYNPESPAPAVGFEIFASEMTLNMQLLHEGDLFALLDQLDEQARGLYSVSGCELTRNFVELTDNPEAGNITATCLLEWFSIKPAVGTELQA